MVTDARPRSVYELIGREWGVAVTWGESPLVSTLGTTDTIILPNNPRRVGLLMVNLSPNVAYIRPQQPASSTSGIRLDPYGGAFSASWQADMCLPALEWHGVATAEGSSIYVVEVYIR